MNRDSIHEAIREAEASKSKSAIFRCGGREYLLTQDLIDGTWDYR